MRKGELISKALKHYRETILQNTVLDILIAEYGANQHDREALVDTLREYASIDRISAKIEDANKTLSNMGSEVRVIYTPTDDEYNNLVDKYNELYFLLNDLIR